MRGRFVGRLFDGMKILHVVPTFDLAAGGPPRIALRLAAATAELGHDVTLMSYGLSPDTRPAVDADRATVPGVNAVHYIELPAPANSLDRLTARSARRTLDDQVRQFDLVHTHDVWTPLSRAAMASANAAGVPFVLLPNGMLDPWSLAQKRVKKSLVLALGHRRLMSRAAFIHVGNVDEEHGVRRAGVTAPTETVPNGINPAEFTPPPPPGAFHAARPELSGKPYVLFLSRLHFKKGLDYLAPAFAAVAGRHPQVQLVVAGPDDGAGEPFRTAVAAAGLADRVHLTGPIYGPERYAALAGAAAFVLPSRQEGFSIAILEALASGVPVVITDACHFPEVATAGAGEVVPLDVPQIAAALDRVLSDAGDRGQRGRALVLSRYTWPKVAEQLVAAYGRHVPSAR